MTFKKSWRRGRWPLIGGGLAGVTVAGCLNLRPLPPVNLEEPGWTVRHGQAVWKMPGDRPELAGELLLAERADGRTFVQFTKTPFPFVIAQTTTNGWSAEFPAQNRRYSGPGSGPARIPWLHLPTALAGKKSPRDWHLSRQATNSWTFKNERTGEKIEAVLD